MECSRMSQEEQELEVDSPLTSCMMGVTHGEE